MNCKHVTKRTRSVYMEREVSCQQTQQKGGKWKVQLLDSNDMNLVTRIWKLNITESLDILASFKWNKTNIVKLMHKTQHKPIVTSNIILWADHYVMVMRQTAYHVNACFKAVCSTMENHVITPCTICLHACEVSVPRWISINKVEEICPIRL